MGSSQAYYNRTKKPIFDGIKFDSQDELDYYKVLLEKKKAGVIKEIEIQPKLSLIPKFYYHGELRRQMNYILDFRVVYSDGVEVYIDIKGMATPQAKMKKRMAEYLYPEKYIVWLRKSKKWGDRTGWIEYDELERIRRENRKKKGRS